MKQIIFVCFLVLNLSYAGDSLDFQLDGKSLDQVNTDLWKKDHLKSFSKKYPGIKLTQAKLYNVHRKYTKTYEGFNFEKVMNKIYGKSWTKSKIIIFEAKDGFKKGTKTEVFIEAIKNKRIGLISFKEKDKKGFTKIKKGDKEIDPGELYLVWTGFKEGDKNSETQKELQWPYQMKSINVKMK